MCGILGVLSFGRTGLMYKDIKIFDELLTVSVLRGGDGTGIFYVGDKDSGINLGKKQTAYTSWIKLAGTPQELFASDEYQKAEKFIRNSRFLVGHCRAATKGEVSNDNCHPFERGHITLVHNGTLRSLSGEDKLDNYTVDSDGLADMLAKHKAPEAIQKINGAMAAVWYDAKESKIKVYRNIERPLFYVEDGQTIFFASEKAMLSWILIRNNNQPFKEITMFEPGMLYEFSHTDKTPKTTKIVTTVLHKTQPIYHPYGGYDGYHHVNGYHTVYEDPEYHTGADCDASCEPVSGGKKTPAEKVNPEVPPVYKGSVINLPAVLRSNRRMIYTPMKEYFGVKVGDRVLVEPQAVEWDKEKKRWRGSFSCVANITTKCASVSALVKEARMVASMKITDKDDLWNSPFVAADVSSIVIAKDDPTDVIAYLNDVRPVDTAKFDTLINSFRG